MKKVLFIFMILFVNYQCNSQSVEAKLYVREELVRQRDDLLRQVKEIQTRIDAIGNTLDTKSKSKTKTNYLTKNIKYNSETNYSNSFNNSTSRKKPYRSRKTRTYHRGPRGGCYYINSNGNKTYVARSMCN